MAAERVHQTPRILEWGVSGRALPGQSESGDQYCVADCDGGTLVAVIDGLGHGAAAAAAAQAASAILERHAGEPLIPLVQRCHEELRGTRGVALSAAFFEAEAATMTWLAVGNVEGVLFRADKAVQPAREPILLRGGVVGYQIPPLRATILPLSPGDTLVFATDGISGGFDQESPIGHDPQEAADHILAHFAKKIDDALVLVARYRGGSP